MKIHKFLLILPIEVLDYSTFENRKLNMENVDVAKALVASTMEKTIYFKLSLFGLTFS